MTIKREIKVPSVTISGEWRGTTSVLSAFALCKESRCFSWGSATWQHCVWFTCFFLLCWILIKWNEPFPHSLVWLDLVSRTDLSHIMRVFYHSTMGAGSRISIAKILKIIALYHNLLQNKKRRIDAGKASFHMTFSNASLEIWVLHRFRHPHAPGAFTLILFPSNLQ